MQQPWYCTRESVKRALDSAETARNNTIVDRAIGSASWSIEQLCHRAFYPFDGTRYFGYPRRDSSSWRLWFNQHDLISATSVISGGTTISSSDYFLEPANSGPPYESLEIDQGSSAFFASGDTWQRSIQITGTWGYWEELESVGTLSDTLAADMTDTANITWTDPLKVGVGSLLKIGSERIIVTEMSFVDSTQDIQSSLTASNADVTVAVSNDAGFYVGEIIRVDSERMLVVDIATNSLIVKRAWDGSVLASHSSNASVYGKTGIEITRAQLGTSLAAHTSTDVVYRWVPPPLVEDLCIAESIMRLQQEQSAYARQASSGESERNVFGAGIGALRTQVHNTFGRKVRHRAV